MPSREQLMPEWERYRSYYERLRTETGVPSIFEIYWAAHLSAAAQLHGGQLDPKLTGWINEPELTRYYSPELVCKRIIEQVASCHSCDLARSRTKTVPGCGPLRTDLMFVGEAPGKDEDAIGLPFIGKSGVWFFDDILPKKMGKTRRDAYIVNTLKCRPPGNRDPKAQELEACRGFLTRQIAMVNPKLIVTLGKAAARWLTGQPVNKLAEVGGKIHWYAHIPVLCAPHPAANVRNHAAYDPQTFQVLDWANWILNQDCMAEFWSK